MGYAHKPFDPVAHREFDALGKLAVMEALQARFPLLKVVPHQDKIGSGEYADILVVDPTSSEVVHRVEVEVKREWQDGRKSFSHPSFHIPSRKLKTEYAGITMHAIVSGDESGIFFVDRDVVKRAPKVRKSCSNYGEVESFQSIIRHATMPGRFYMRRMRREDDWQEWDGC